LLAVSLFLYRMGKPIIYTMIPMIAMMIMTITAMVLKLRANLSAQNWPLLVVGAIILVLVMWLVIESVLAFRRHLPLKDGE
jgi:carbon starvation protein